MIAEKKWYAVLVRERHEKRVMKSLGRQNIEFFYPVCPVNEDEVSDRGNHIEKALFPATIFVHIPEWQVLETGRTKHVTSFLYWLNKPAVISQQDISAIADFLKTYEKVSLKKSGYGVFVKDGSAPRQPVEDLICINLESLGFTLVAQHIKNKYGFNPAESDNLLLTKYSFTP